MQGGFLQHSSSSQARPRSMREACQRHALIIQGTCKNLQPSACERCLQTSEHRAKGHSDSTDHIVHTACGVWRC
eukprot:1171687-Lingulodinium_polyedra.AAC.1